MKDCYPVFKMLLLSAILLCPVLTQAQEGDVIMHVSKKQRGCTKIKGSELTEAGLLGKVKTTITRQSTNKRVIAFSAKAYTETTTANYDSSGTLRDEHIDYSSGARSVHERQFNKEGRLLTDVFHNADSSFYRSTMHRYDSSGRLAQVLIDSYDAQDGYQNTVINYDRSGNCLERSSQREYTRYLYDGYGHCLQMTKVAYDKVRANDTTVTLYLYDENCRLTASARTGGSLAKTTYKYDDKDSLIESYEEDMSKEQKVYKTYKYDDHGNRTEEKTEIIPYGQERSRQMIMGNQYEYDSHGNWILKVIYFGGVEIAREEREIIYY